MSQSIVHEGLAGLDSGHVRGTRTEGRERPAAVVGRSIEDPCSFNNVPIGRDECLVSQVQSLLLCKYWLVSRNR